MTSTEQRYAQIEKEALPTTWACEKFAEFVLGKEFLIETDYKPLVPLLGSKCLQDMPPRIQRFWMRLMRCSYQIVHLPGKDLTTADNLSRVPLHRSLTKDEKQLNEDVNLYVSHIVECLPTTERRLQEICLLLDEDEVCSKLKLFCSEGCPEKHHLNCSLQPYWQYRADITVQQGILMKDERVIIPSALRLDVLDKIYTHGSSRDPEMPRKGEKWCLVAESQQADRFCQRMSYLHQDENKSCRTHDSFTVTRASIPKSRNRSTRIERTRIRTRGRLLLAILEYLEYGSIGVLRKSTSQEVINHLKAIFVLHGIPETVISNNGPQYSSAEFAKFAEDWSFTHITSSPKYPQRNG